MLDGLYTALAGMEAQQRATDATRYAAPSQTNTERQPIVKRIRARWPQAADALLGAR